MRWIRDDSGRFRERPYYETDEIDAACEAIVAGFLQECHGSVFYPITTDDLVRLIERRVADLDLYANLSSEGPEVHGVTEFFPDSKPSVRIAGELDDPRRRNRQRSTLTHEFGHVELHTCLWNFDQLEMPLLTDVTARPSPRCHRDNIVRANRTDWLEWQAGYASGSFLMPISAVRRCVGAFNLNAGVVGAVYANGTEGRSLVRRLATDFQVSEEAARVRLSALGHLTDREPPRSFFAS